MTQITKGKDIKFILLEEDPGPTLSGGDGFDTDYTRQDAAILNIQRVCEAAMDVGQHIIREKQLGLPQSARDVFTLR